MKLFNKFKKKDQPKVEKVNVAHLQNKKDNNTTQPTIIAPKPIIFDIRHVDYTVIKSPAGKQNKSTTLNLPRLYISQTLVAPQGMNLEDVCKVISFLTEQTANTKNLSTQSLENIFAVEHILSDYGFASYFYSNKSTQAIQEHQIFYLEGNIMAFESSYMYKDYFEWYTPNISETEIQAIYSKIGKTLPSSQSEPENN